jgi:hypothetical protein
MNAIAHELFHLPLTFCAPVIFGLHPREVGLVAARVHTATATYIDLAGPKGVINWHVLEAYRRELAADQRVRFQLLDVTLNPYERLVAVNETTDLAVLDLSGLTVELERGVNIRPLLAYNPLIWPPDPAVAVGDVLTVGGYPESLRTGDETDPEVIHHASFSYAGLVVSDVYEDRFYAKVSVDRVSVTEGREGDAQAALANFSGLSGSPAFRDRGALGVLNPFSLVGIVYGWDHLGKRLQFSSVANIKRDGTLWMNTKR